MSCTPFTLLASGVARITGGALLGLAGAWGRHGCLGRFDCPRFLFRLGQVARGTCCRSLIGLGLLACDPCGIALGQRSEEHTSELQSLMRISYAVFCLKKKKKHKNRQIKRPNTKI